MEEFALIELFQQALWKVMLTVGLLTLPALIVGIIISILQAATQINEMSLTFIPKLMVMIMILIISLPWLLANLVHATQELMYELPQYLT